MLTLAMTFFFFLQRIECNDIQLSITMHDQIRELARHIAREEFHVRKTRNPLRLSSSNDLDEMLRLQEVFITVLFYSFTVEKKQSF
jgi:hypothetical protein